MKAKLKAFIDSLLPEISALYSAEIPSDFAYEVETPRGEEHGDFATNLALKLARLAKKKPADVAQDLKKIFAANLEKDPVLSKAVQKMEIEGPGFINFYLAKNSLTSVLLDIQSKGAAYGQSDFGKGKKVVLEYVSANPTGPLTIAHGRQACIGDSLGRILKITGHTVHREYYLNDTGRQITILGRSTYLRYRELFGETIEFPEEGYQGSYIRDLAQQVKDAQGDKFLKEPEEKAIPFFSTYAADEIMKGIVKDLDTLDVKFDNYFSEKKLRESGRIEEVLNILRAKGYVFEEEGAVWFRSTAFGDDKDRVLRKSTGEYTYLAPDIAYHEDKFRRGFGSLINLWGPDHHGYVPRMKAAVRAFGGNEEMLNVLLVQLTTLYRNGQPVRMSTRAGEFVTLRELMDEVGVDATRMFFALRRVESLLDFDLDLAKAQSNDNPVYYLQYAHARISSIVSNSEVKFTGEADLDLLKEKEEFDLIKLLAEYPLILLAAARGLEPYRVVEYLRELATRFHKFYTLHRVLTDDLELSRARLFLIGSVRTVLRNGLETIGVSQPEKM